MLKHFNQSRIRLSDFLNSSLGTIAKFAVSLLILFYFFHFIDLELIKTILRELEYHYILLLVLMVIIRNWLAAIRFQFLTSLRKNIGIWLLNKQYFVAAMFNLLLPTSLGGDGVRVIMLSNCGISKMEGLSFIVIERVIGLFSLFLIALFACFFMPPQLPIYLIIIAVNLSFAFVLYLIIYNKKSLRWFDETYFERVNKILKPLKTHKRIIIYTFLFSILFQLAGIYLSYLVAVAFNINVSFVSFLVFIPLISLFTMIPISLGGIGLRELSYVYLFSSVNLSNESALILSLGTYFTLLVGGFIGAGIYFYDKIWSEVKKMA